MTDVPESCRAALADPGPPPPLEPFCRPPSRLDVPRRYRRTAQDPSSDLPESAKWDAGVSPSCSALTAHAPSVRPAPILIFRVFVLEIFYSILNAVDLGTRSSTRDFGGRGR